MSRVPLLREIAGNKLWRTRGSHLGTNNGFFNSLPSYFFAMHQYTIKMLVESPKKEAGFCIVFIKLAVRHYLFGPYV